MSSNRKIQGVKLGERNVSADGAMGRVIDIQEKLETMRREVAALRRDRKDLLAEYTDLQNARPVPKLRTGKVKSRPDGKIRVAFGDVHGMMMDDSAVKAMLADIRILDPDEIVIGGDLVDCGGWLAKHQPIGFVAQCDYTYQEDIAASNAFLDALRKAAPRAEIHYLEGNHEDRVERWVVDQVMASKRDAEFLRGLASPEILLRLAERGIKYYRRSEIYVKGLPRGWIKLDNMCYTHSLSYSKNAARDAAQRTAGNVTYFCSHRRDAATIVFPAVGLVEAFNPGCLCLMNPVWQRSNPTEWSQGYSIEYVAPNGSFQRIPVPIWGGESLALSMLSRLKG